MTTIYIPKVLCDYPDCQGAAMEESQETPADIWAHFPRGNKGKRPEVVRVDLCHEHAELMKKIAKHFQTVGQPRNLTVSTKKEEADE